MAANRGSRRAAASKKKGGKHVKTANGKSNGMPAIPKLSGPQQRRLRKIRDAMTATKCRVAELDMEKDRQKNILAAQMKNFQAAIQSAIQAAGVDLEESPPGQWVIDFDSKTMDISFQPDPGAPVAQPAA